MANYTLFTEVDPNNRFAITTNKITVTDLANNEVAYIYNDNGASFFDGDFTHKVDVITGTVVALGDAVMGVWCLANAINDIGGLQSASESHFRIQINKNSVSTERVFVIERDVATNYFDIAIVTYGQQFYYTIERDETVGTYGTLYCYIYTDSARTILFDTLSVALHSSKKDFRYVYAVQSNDFSSANKLDAVIENLDLNIEINTTTVGVATAVANGATSIDVSMPYTNDDNANSTYTVDYKLSEDASYTNFITADTNTPSPYTNTITGLLNGRTYDVKMTYNDTDGVTGTNPQTVTDILLTWVETGVTLLRRIMLFKSRRHTMELNTSRKTMTNKTKRNTFEV